MSYKQVVSNINKILIWKRLQISDLSEKTGLTVNGIKNMFNTGSFKLDSLNKIASALDVPVFLFFASYLNYHRDIINKKYHYVIEYDMPSFEKEYYDYDFNENGFIITKSKDKIQIAKDWSEYENEKEKYKNSLSEKEELIETLKSQLEDKEMIIDFLKKEKLLYQKEIELKTADIIDIIIKIKKNKNHIDVFKELNLSTLERINDSEFLKNLQEKDFITKDQYDFFLRLKKEIDDRKNNVNR